MARLGTAVQVLLLAWAVHGEVEPPDGGGSGSAMRQSGLRGTKPQLVAQPAGPRGSVADLAAAALQLGAVGRSSAGTASLQEAIALLDLMAENRTHLDGVDKEELERIRASINATLVGNLLNLTAADQAEVDADYLALTRCDGAREGATQSSLADASGRLDSMRSSHRACRGTESTAATANGTAWAELKALEVSIPAPPAAPEYIPTLSHMSSFFSPESNPQLKWYDEHRTSFATKQAAVDSRRGAWQDQKAECDTEQRDFEQEYCFYRDELLSVCTAYAACHRDALGKYQATVRRVQDKEATHKDIYRSVAAFVCHLDVILAGSANQSHDDCVDRVASLEMESLSIEYPTPPSQSVCDTSGVWSTPCDADWVAKEFSSWMPDNVAAASCSRCPSETPAPTPAPLPAPTPAPTPAPPPIDPVSGAELKILLDFSNGFVPTVGPADLITGVVPFYNNRPPDESKIVDDPTGLPRKVLALPLDAIRLKEEYFQFGTKDFAIQVDQRRNVNAGNVWVFTARKTVDVRGPYIFDIYNDYLCAADFGCPNTNCCDWSEWHTHKMVRKGGQLIQYIDGVETNRFGNNPQASIDPAAVFLGGNPYFTGHIANLTVFY